MTTYHYYLRRPYGTPRFYPLNEEFTVAHYLISKNRTLNRNQIEGYRLLGIDLEESKEDEDYELPPGA